TNAGPIVVHLDNAKAPCTVNSFVSLAKQGYFDNTPCHRLAVSAAMSVLQCGDPTGKGTGGPGYLFGSEYPTNQYRPFDPALKQPVIYPRGTLAMANSGANSNGSQFMIVYKDSEMAPQYTAFGRVDEAGLALVDRLAAAGINGGADDGEPARPITITSLTVK
ncbi:MAG: peptidylprolyl isomerase, partial [Mycobacterium sp.]